MLVRTGDDLIKIQHVVAPDSVIPTLHGNHIVQIWPVLQVTGDGADGKPLVRYHDTPVDVVVIDECMERAGIDAVAWEHLGA